MVQKAIIESSTKQKGLSEMEKRDFELLISTGTIETVSLYQEGESAIRVYVYGEDYHGKNEVQAQRGGPREFATFDAAVRFVRSCGWRQPIMLDQGGL